MDFGRMFATKLEGMQQLQKPQVQATTSDQHVCCGLESSKQGKGNFLWHFNFDLNPAAVFLKAAGLKP